MSVSKKDADVASKLLSLALYLNEKSDDVRTIDDDQDCLELIKTDIQVAIQSSDPQHFVDALDNYDLYNPDEVTEFDVTFKFLALAISTQLLKK
jgi:hypothetical protein